MVSQTKFLVSKKQIISYVAHYIISQSPYDIPNNLELVLRKLNSNVQPLFEKLKYVKFTQRQLYKIIQDNLKVIPQFLELNKSKNDPNSQKQLFISAYSEIDPDDDFIDVQALFRNVTNGIVKQCRDYL